jgi:hypothetical protein
MGFPTAYISHAELCTYSGDVSIGLRLTLIVLNYVYIAGDWMSACCAELKLKTCCPKPLETTATAVKYCTFYILLLYH